MKAFAALVWSEVLSAVRHPLALLLPVALVLLFGRSLSTALDDPLSDVVIAVPRCAATNEADALTTAVRRAGGVVRRVDDEAAAERALVDGRVDGVIERACHGDAATSVLVDPLNQKGAQLVRAIVDDVSSRENLRRLPAERRFRIPVGNLETRDTYTPFSSVLGMLLMYQLLSSAMLIQTNQVASTRERGVLRSLAVTPLSTTTYVAATVVARVSLTVVQTVVTLVAVDQVVGAGIAPVAGHLSVVLIGGVALFSMVGTIVGLLAPNVTTAGAIAAAMFFGLTLAGGIGGAPTNLDGWRAWVPTTVLNGAISRLLAYGAHDFAWVRVMGLWLGISIALCVRFARLRSAPEGWQRVTKRFKRAA